MLNKHLNTKRVFKEKIVHIYISLIKDEELSNENFWNEFFLLKANGTSLEQELAKIDNINTAKRIINVLFEKSLDAIQDSNQLKIINGLITLCSISHHVLFTIKSNLQKGTNKDEDIFEILFGTNSNPKQPLNKFIESTCALLFCEDIHCGIKSIALKLLLIFSMAFSDINSNKFLENFISYHQVFDALIDLLNSSNQQFQDELRILLLLTIILNYKKPKTNPYVMKLSIVDNEIILNRYSQAITNQLIKFNLKFDQLNTENKSGLFSSISNMVGTIFSNEDNNSVMTGIISKKFPFPTVNLVLLAFYEAVSLNRNFISLLTTTSPELLHQNRNDCNEPTHHKFYGLTPPNLLVAFLEFSSIIMLGMKDEVTTQTIRLCFIILTCITEDACANSIIHDNNISFIVNLKRMPMRHRKLSVEKSKGVLLPICHTILDLMIEFILVHLNRHTNHELFIFCLGIIHRLLCFQKRCKVRIHFDWKELWSSLILLIKFLLNNESYFLKHQFDIFTVSQQIIVIFNMFILYGDNFLYNDLCYDELYYEIIRMHTVFDNLNSFALRHTKEDTNNNYKDASKKLTNILINIKAIIAHLNAKLEMYSSQNKIVTLSEEQVFEVVRNNYDSLTLKLTENLDLYEPYNFAKSNEIEFFSNILASVIEDFVNTKQFSVSCDEQHNLIQEIKIMSAVNLGSCNSNTYFESSNE